MGDLKFEFQYPLLIGITGRKFNGKDTMGDRLVNNHEYKKYAFANPLKEACREIFGFNDEQLYGSLKETEDKFWRITPRKLLQFVGTDLFRDKLMDLMPHIGSNVWVEVTKRKILQEWENNPKQKIVITDVRFDNEVNMIRELGGIIIRVSRPDFLLSNYPLSQSIPSDDHESERNPDHLTVTCEIQNNSSKDDLYIKLDQLLEKSNWD